MSESAVQDGASDAMASTLRAWARREARGDGAAQPRGPLGQDNPRVGVDPDVCLLDPPPATPEAELTGLRLWEGRGNHPPRVAFEVVSASTARKDYDEGLRKHAASGRASCGCSTRCGSVRRRRRAGGSRVWSRGPRGVPSHVTRGDGPSGALGGAGVAARQRRRMLLRVCDDPAGTRPWPTEAEEARAHATRWRRRIMVAAQRDAVAAQRDAVAAQRDAVAERAEGGRQLARRRAGGASFAKGREGR